MYAATGVLHNFPEPAPAELLRTRGAPPATALRHYDTAATGLAPIRARMFHRARMRPRGRHDGVAPARRAHHDDAPCGPPPQPPDMRPLLHRPRRAANPVCTTLRPVIGVRPHCEAPSGRSSAPSSSVQATR